MAQTTAAASAWHRYTTEHPLPSIPRSIQAMRTGMKELGEYNQNFLSKPPFDMLTKKVDVENTTILLPERPGVEFGLRVYKPKGYKGDHLPIMLYFHGGFWCSGDANSEDFGCRAIITGGTEIVIASFEYRLAPESPWHEIFSDAEYAMKWINENASQFGADVKAGFIVGGATSGAHLAAICAIRARDCYPNIKLTGQNLIVPIMIHWPDNRIPEMWKKHLRSHIEQADAAILDQAAIELFLTNLGVPDEERRKGTNFPLWAELHDLPPAYLPMDELDPTRDDGFLYAERLREAGVLTRTDYYQALPNMFVQFVELETTMVAGIHLGAAIKWLLQDRK